MLELSCQDYRIYIGDVVESLSQFLEDRSYSKIAVIVDQNTRIHCLPILTKSMDTEDWCVIEVPAGEEYKTIKSCEDIWKRLLMAGIDRHSLVINLGGGVIGDMGGFCAATFMRGIDFVQVPTTLLSQVDASVGGKLGVDLEYVKNIIGTFENPKAVFVDKCFLKTLDFLQLRSGFAEVVKHSLIYDDDLWKSVKDFELDSKNITDDFLFQSIQVKKEVVETDPREKGLRKTLNYGHTIGHGIETNSWSTEEPLLHGEAIFVGMICENYVAFAKNMMSRNELDEINEVIKSVYYNPNSCNRGSEIWGFMKNDKKNKLNKVFAAFITSIGSAVYDIEITREEVMDSFSYYQNL